MWIIWPGQYIRRLFVKCFVSSNSSHFSHALSWTKASLCKGVYASTFHPLPISPSADNRNPFISQLSTFTLSLFAFPLKLYSLSVSAASGLLFQSAQNTPVFVWSVSFIFLTLDVLQGRGGQGRMGKRRRSRRRRGARHTRDVGQIPLLWGVLGIRDMVGPLEHRDSWRRVTRPVAAVSGRR